MSYVFPSFVLVTLVLTTYLVAHVPGQVRLTMVAPCKIGVPWLATVLGMLKDIDHWFPITKKLHHGCFSRLDVQGSAIVASNLPAARDVCCTCEGSLS